MEAPRLRRPPGLAARRVLCVWRSDVLVVVPAGIVRHHVDDLVRIGGHPGLQPGMARGCLHRSAKRGSSAAGRRGRYGRGPGAPLPDGLACGCARAARVNARTGEAGQLSPDAAGRAGNRGREAGLGDHGQATQGNGQSVQTRRCAMPSRAKLPIGVAQTDRQRSAHLVAAGRPPRRASGPPSLSPVPVRQRPVPRPGSAERPPGHVNSAAAFRCRGPR